MKKWQWTFFYVRTPDDEADCLNLTLFSLDPPHAKTNWGVKVGHGDTDLDRMANRVRELCDEGWRQLTWWSDSSSAECSRSSADLTASAT